jgi:predicted HTH domain antitoxin
MTTLELSINDHSLAGVYANDEELRQDLREVLAAKLFELGRLTLAQAAEVADLPVWSFMERLSRLKVSVINQGVDDLLNELETIRD